MISKCLTYSLLVLFLWSVKSGYNTQDSLSPILHKIEITHPAEQGSITVDLYEVKNTKGDLVEYFMDVPSVICLEEVCKVIPVRIFWNPAGKFLNYKLEDGATLEKYESDVFSAKDYKKLQTILANPNSPFKDVYFEDILTVVDEGDTDDVDAVSGATAIVLDEEDTVPGAALTCFTLWHWVNGEVQGQIKNITKKSITDKQLLNYVRQANLYEYVLAVEILESRKLFSEDYVNAIITSCLDESELLPQSIKYLEAAPSDIYLKSMKQILNKGDKLQRIAVLKSLYKSDLVAPKAYLDSISNSVSKLNSVQEFTAYFELMELKNSNSEIVVNNVVILLDRDFLTARLAYWFLNGKTLTDDQNKQLSSFYNNHKNKL